MIKRLLLLVAVLIQLAVAVVSKETVSAVAALTAFILVFILVLDSSESPANSGHRMADNPKQ